MLKLFALRTAYFRASGCYCMRKIREEEPKTELSGLEQPHRTTVVSTQPDFNTGKMTFALSVVALMKEGFSDRNISAVS